MTGDTTQPLPVRDGANGPPRSVETEVLTLAEAAAFLRVSEAGLLEDATAGRLPGRRVGGEWRFVKGGLLNWLANATADREVVTGSDRPVPETVLKAVLPDPDRNRGLLASIGAFAHDDTLEPMVEQIYRERKRRAGRE